MAGSEAEDCRATSREEPAFGCLRNPRAGASLVTVPEGRKSLGPGPGGGGFCAVNTAPRLRHALPAWGLLGISKTLAREAASSPRRCSPVSPGGVLATQEGIPSWCPGGLQVTHTEEMSVPTAPIPQSPK